VPGSNIADLKKLSIRPELCRRGGCSRVNNGSARLWERRRLG
jgi:hypothetical protein